MKSNSINTIFPKRIFTKRFFIVLAVCLACTNLFTYTARAASVPPTILTYQGRLTDASGNLLGGSGTSYYLKFSLWDSPTVGAGTRVWPASVPATTTVTVTQGVFTVNIGDTANGYPEPLNLNLSNYSALYLQVEVSSNNNSSETLSPRQQLTSVPFAHVAGAIVGTTTPSLFGTTTPISSSFVTVQATSSTAVPLSVAGAAGQTANLFQIMNNSLQNLFSVNAAGVVTFASAPIFSSLTSGLHAASLTGATYSAATSSLALSGPFSGASALGALVGGTNSTITWTGLATTSQPASSNLLVSNGAAGVYGVATSTLTPSSPLTGSFTVLGSGGSLGCQTANGSQAGCLSSTDWTTFNNKAGFSYLFPNNATTTGLGIFASSTVGAGAQNSGLTIFGGATTTGYMKITGTSGTTTIAAGQGFAVGSSQFVVHQGSGSASGVSIGTANPEGYFTALNSISGSAVNIDLINNAAVALNNEVRLRLQTYSGQGSAANASYISSYVSNNATGANDMVFGVWGGGAPGLSEVVHIKGGATNLVGIGTSTPQWNLQVAGTRPSFALSDASAGANLKHWLISSMGGTLYVGTSTDAYATSSLAALSVSSFGTTTLRGLSLVGATTTSAVGFNISGGCFAVNNTCVSGGAGGGASLSVANVWSALQQFNANASSTQFSATQAYFGGTGTSTFTSDGFLGIGTTSPFASLSVSGVGTNKTFLAIDDTASVVSDTLIRLQANGIANDSYFINALDSADGTQKFYVKGDGKGFFGGTVTVGTGVAQTSLVINGSGTDSYNGLAIKTAGTEKWFIGRDGTDSTDDLILRASANTDVMRIINSGAVAGTLVLKAGNVGIGTSTPQWDLQVADTRPNFALSDMSAGANLKHWLFSSMGGNLYIGTSTDAYATTTAAVITAMNNGRVGIGSSTPFAALSIMKGLDEAFPSFVVATSSVWNTAQVPLIYSFATTTGAQDYARVAIGTSTMWGASGIRDQLTVAGRIYSSWRYLSCDALGGAFPTNVTITTDTAVAQYPGLCGQFAYDFNGGNALTVASSSPILQLSASNATPAAANAVTLRTGAAITNVTQNPVLEAWVMASTTLAATSTPMYQVGFSNVTYNNGAPNTLPTAAAYFIATSTQNWIAVTRSAANIETYTNTGVSTSSLAVANATSTGVILQKMRVEVTATRVIFLIDGRVVASHTTNIPPVTAALSPLIMVDVFAQTSAGTLAYQPRMLVSLLRVWTDDPANAPEASPLAGSQDDPLFDRVEGADIATNQLVDEVGRFLPGMLVSSATSTNATTSTSMVRLSHVPYDKDMLGVVSTAPYTSLGMQSQRTVRVGTLGRVPVIVSLENGPIAQGDRITASSIVGVGMRAKRAGQVVGRAVETFNPDAGIGTCNEQLKTELGIADNNVCVARVLVALTPGTDLSIGDMLQDVVGAIADLPSALVELTNDAFSSGAELTKFVVGEVVAKTAVIGKIFSEHVFAKQLDVGTSSEPAGVTLYDTATHAPYCLLITNGSPVASAGVCGTQSSEEPPPDAPVSEGDEAQN